ncbi:histidine kinase [Micromonospora sp. NPDC049559]|uniref:sensor histidine kinase n=1 Tax=Micromonospora sp. NPDC049559 TaxID=3155923 RepID=UPI0034244E33
MTGRLRQVAVRAGVAVALCVAATLAWAGTGVDEFWPRWVYFAVGTVLTGEFVLRRVLRVPRGRLRWLAVDGAAGGMIMLVDLAVYVLTGGGYFWPVWTYLGFSGLFALHVWVVSRPPGARERELTARVARLARSRRAAVDRQAAELKRVERDLHDGAQARIASLALTLGLAGELLRRDPDAAARLIDEGRLTAVAALEDLRAVMHSIHPAVLADRGLGDAVRALALNLAVPVTVTGDPPPALPASIETAVYFAIAECLGNVVKHSGAATEVAFVDDPGSVLVTVTDSGVGGADPARGTGLRGIIDRLDVVDAELRLSSPPGGPTVVTIIVPLG